MTEIRNILYENNCTKKYLRYAIEIFYHINEDITPIKFTADEMDFMSSLYKLVIEYEKTNHIKLPQSKVYFTKKFIQYFFPEKMKSFFLITGKKNIVNKYKYKECLNKILHHDIVKRWKNNF